VPEIIDDGRNGLLTPSPEPAGIAEAVLRLLEDPVLARRLAEEGRRTVQSRFSANQMVEGTLDVYRQL
jgi:glycosyltransferase involved in cell wall biosynthesis